SAEVERRGGVGVGKRRFGRGERVGGGRVAAVAVVRAPARPLLGRGGGEDLPAAGQGVHGGGGEGGGAEAVVEVCVGDRDDQRQPRDLADRRGELGALAGVPAGVDDERALGPEHQTGREVELGVPAGEHAVADLDPAPVHQPARRKPSCRRGTAALTSRSAASSTSAAKPSARSSRPELVAASAAGRPRSRAAGNCATASSASGERSGSAAAMAPAPSASSAATRMVSSGHRSPAGTIPIGPPTASAAAATAEALRRQPASSTAPVAATAAQSVAPLGEGSASRVPAGSPVRDAGESDGPVLRRGPARTTPGGTGRREADARSGSTAAPRPAATPTAAENDSTSTTITTAHSAVSSAAPSRPHSRRTRWSSWRCSARTATPGTVLRRTIFGEGTDGSRPAPVA